MDVKQIISDGLRRGYDISIPGNEIETAVQEKLSTAATSFSRKGFRKGKVPVHILKGKIGRNLLDETIRETVNKAVTTVIENAGEPPVFTPQANFMNENWQEGDDVRVNVYFEVQPVFPEIDFQSLTIEEIVFDVSDQFLDRGLVELLKKKAQDESDVHADIRSEDRETTIDGSFASHLASILFGTDDVMSEEMSENESGEKSDVRSPDWFPENDVLTDAIAKHFGYEDLVHLRRQAHEQCRYALDSFIQHDTKLKVFDAIDNVLDVEVPPSFVQQEAADVAMKLTRNRQTDEGGDDRETVQPSKENVELARRRVKLSFFMQHLAAKVGLEVNSEETRKAVAMQAVSGAVHSGQLSKGSDKIQISEQDIMLVHQNILENKVFQYLLELVAVKKIEWSDDDAFTILFLSKLSQVP